MQIPYANTAMAAKYISELNDVSKAAICSQRAAKLYNLHILQEEINTKSNNFTRKRVFQHIGWLQAVC